MEFEAEAPWVQRVTADISYGFRWRQIQESDYYEVDYVRKRFPDRDGGTDYRQRTT